MDDRQGLADRFNKIETMLKHPLRLAEALYSLLRDLRARDSRYVAAASVCAGLVAVLEAIPDP